MPWSTNTFSSLETGDILTHCDNVSDYLVSWNSGERVAQESLTLKLVSVADATGQNLYEYLTLAGHFKVDILERDVGVLALDDGGLVGLGKRRSHDAKWTVLEQLTIRPDQVSGDAAQKLTLMLNKVMAFKSKLRVR